MGDENTILDVASGRHLMRRTLLGGGPDGMDRYDVTPGVTSRGEAADAILAARPRKFRPASRDHETAHARWVKWLIRTKAEFQSRLVFFFHDHFATAISTVDDPKMMGDQIKLLYEYSFGNFRDFVKAINKNPAMMEFLDTVRNDKKDPNENYARELQELFTLGVVDLTGAANYEQEDIVQIARAFTGWRHDGRNAWFDTGDHDFMVSYPSRGPKTIFPGVHGFPPAGGDIAGNGEGEAEIDTVIDLLFQHQDSQGQNTVARRMTHRLLEYFTHATPSVATIDQIIAESGFDTSFELAPLYRAILVNDAFYETAGAAPFDPSMKKSFKWPIDYVVSSLRLMKMKLKSRYAYVDGGSYTGIHDQLTEMGQALLDPPSVFGWDWEKSWISTATLLARYRFASDLVSARYGGKRFKPDKVIDLDLTDPVEIVDAVLDALDVAHHFEASTHTLLVDYLTEGGTLTPDLQDDDYRNTKLHGLFLLVLQSPQYQVF